MHNNKRELNPFEDEQHDMHDFEIVEPTGETTDFKAKKENIIKVLREKHRVGELLVRPLPKPRLSLAEEKTQLEQLEAKKELSIAQRDRLWEIRYDENNGAFRRL